MESGITNHVWKLRELLGQESNSMRVDPPPNSPFERVPTVYSANEIRSLIEDSARNAGINVGPLQGNEFYLSHYSDGKVDLLVNVTSDSVSDDFIQRTLSVLTPSGEQL